MAKLDWEEHRRICVEKCADLLGKLLPHPCLKCPRLHNDDGDDGGDGGDGGDAGDNDDDDDYVENWADLLGELLPHPNL